MNNLQILPEKPVLCEGRFTRIVRLQPSGFQNMIYEVSSQDCFTWCNIPLGCCIVSPCHAARENKRKDPEGLWDEQR